MKHIIGPLLFSQSAVRQASPRGPKNTDTILP